MPMPGVFSAINSSIQGNLVGKDLKYLSQKLPDGLVECQEGWVESKQVPGTNLYIKGKFDLLVKLGDDSHMLVDLKISDPSIDKIDKYKSQLNAYRYAIENQAEGNPVKISRLGLLMFYPKEVKFENSVANLAFPPKWLEVPIEEEEFLKFVKGIDTLLAGPTPQESETCQLCKYRHLGDSWTHKDQTKDVINF